MIRFVILVIYVLVCAVLMTVFTEDVVIGTITGFVAFGAAGIMYRPRPSVPPPSQHPGYGVFGMP